MRAEKEGRNKSASKKKIHQSIKQQLTVTASRFYLQAGGNEHPKTILFSTKKNNNNKDLQLSSKNVLQFYSFQKTELIDWLQNQNTPGKVNQRTGERKEGEASGSCLLKMKMECFHFC